MAENLTGITESLDPERQEQARAYARIRRRLYLVELGVGLAYLLIWIFTGLPGLLRDAIYQFSQATWLSVPLFALGFGVP